MKAIFATCGAGLRTARTAGKTGTLATIAAAAFPAIALLGSASVASATMITPNGVTNITSPTGTVGISSGTVGNDGYYFVGGTSGQAFNSANSTSKLPSYVSSVTPFSKTLYNGSGYTSFTLNTGSGSSSFATSTDFDGATTAATLETLATITLSSSVPAAFQLGVLGDNTGGASAYENDTQFYLTEFNSLGTQVVSTTELTADPSNVASKSNFYLANISGASPGDIINILGENGTYVTSGTTTNLKHNFAGVTFDSTPAPEPASLSLLGLGAIGLLARRRRARVEHNRARSLAAVLQ